MTLHDHLSDNANGYVAMVAKGTNLILILNVSMVFLTCEGLAYIYLYLPTFEVQLQPNFAELCTK